MTVEKRIGMKLQQRPLKWTSSHTGCKPQKLVVHRTVVACDTALPKSVLRSAQVIGRTGRGSKFIEPCAPRGNQTCDAGAPMRSIASPTEFSFA
jgi:hypothetical protein